MPKAVFSGENELVVDVLKEARRRAGLTQAELADNGGTMPSSFDPAQTDWSLTLDTVLALTAGGHGADQAGSAAR